MLAQIAESGTIVADAIARCSMENARNPDDRTRILLRFLSRVGRLNSHEAARLERLAIAKPQPVEELLESEGVITQRNLAVLLGEALQLPLVKRFNDGITRPENRLSATATRVAIEMLLDDGIDKLAKGATFEVPNAATEERPPLPLQPEPRSAAIAATTPPPPGLARSFRALVVDDDPDLRRIVRASIERGGLGLTVITAQDAAEALALTELERPDVVILDLSMPGLDGYDVCTRLRSGARTKRVPIIILSANGTSESVDRAMRAGANDYVVKPFSRDDFITRIRRQIERVHRSGSATPPTPIKGAGQAA
jgi:CheY-like chemotaxis protein